jgi:hypothetical protein
MSLFVKDNQAILFVHVPHAGGTTIKVIFEMSDYKVFLHDPGGPDSSNRYRLCSPQHMHAARIMTQVNLDKILGNHLQPQYEFLLPGIEIYRFEEGFTAAKSMLQRKFGVSLTRNQVQARSISPAGEAGGREWFQSRWHNRSPGGQLLESGQERTARR